jgi:hypothetical protein
MLFIMLSLFVSTFVVFWLYLAMTTRHMAKLAQKIPGPKPSPMWKKILKRNTDPLSKNIRILTEILVFCSFSFQCQRVNQTKGAGKN